MPAECHSVAVRKRQYHFTFTEGVSQRTEHPHHRTEPAEPWCGSREGIDGKRPQLSDLRESGAIEQDADMVCFIHRPEYYKIYSDEKGNDLHGMAEIIIAKHRNGAVGDVLLRFRGEFARFQNPDDE